MAQALDTNQYEFHNAKVHGTGTRHYQYEFHNAKVHGTGTRHYINMNSIMPRYMAQMLDTISI